jgi:putative ABC transport system permease protein
MENLKNDLKYAFRILIKNKAICAIAILTLALGIGVNTTIFSLVNSILLRPLPYPNSESIMTITTSWPQKEQSGFSAANFLDLREHNKSFQAISAFGIWGYDISGTKEPEALSACRATHGFFEVMAAKPIYGRAFLPEDEIAGKDQIAILSNSFWKRRFAGDPSIIGKKILLDGLPHEVVGIMDEKFAVPSFVEIWTPLVFTPEQKQQRGSSYLEVIARLKPGITQAQAQSEMNLIAASLAKQFPDYNAGMSIKITPTAEAITGPIKPRLLIFWAAVIFVLLVACANLANLMFASTVSREREFALRVALGASPTHLRRQLLTESLLLSILGGLLGILFSLWAIPAIVTLSPSDTPRIDEVTMNGTVLLFSILLSVLTGIVFGMAPAFSVSKHSPSSFLKEGTSGSVAGPGSVRVRNFLVTAQVAVVLVLLVGAGLMISSFEKLRSVDPGFNPEKLLNLQVFLPRSRYQEPDARRAFSSSLLEKVRALPETELSAIASPAPFDTIPHLIEAGFRIQGEPPRRAGDEPSAAYIRVTEDYFKTMQIQMVKGRSFQASDHQNASRVAVVNEEMERRFWPAKGALGQRIALGIREPVVMEIVGVVKSVKQLDLASTAENQIYVPFNQAPSGAITILVRTKGEPKNVISDLKRQFWAVDPMLPAQYLSTSKDLLSQSLHAPRSNTVLLSMFSAMAFLMAMIGLYGVIAYSVYRRTREIGVRISLGAQRSTILKMILSQGLRLTLFGIAIGTVAALALTTLISSLLYGVSSRDPFIFCLGALAMILVSLLACYIPAHRAMRVDPVVALRYE